MGPIRYVSDFTTPLCSILSTARADSGRRRSSAAHRTFNLFVAIRRLTETDLMKRLEAKRLEFERQREMQKKLFEEQASLDPREIH